MARWGDNQIVRKMQGMHALPAAARQVLLQTQGDSHPARSSAGAAPHSPQQGGGGEGGAVAAKAPAARAAGAPPSPTETREALERLRAQTGQMADDAARQLQCEQQAHRGHLKGERSPAVDVAVIKCRFKSKRAQRPIRSQLFTSTFT